MKGNLKYFRILWQLKTMTIKDLFNLFVSLCTAILLSCSIIVEAQQDPQNDLSTILQDYISRSAEQGSQSSESESSQQDPQNDLSTILQDYNSRSAEQGLQSSESESRSSAPRILEVISDSQSYSYE